MRLEATDITSSPREEGLIELANDADVMTPGRRFAQLYTSPELAAYRVLSATDTKVGLDEAVDVPTMIDQLSEQASAIGSGDLTRVEAMLIGQATALQTLFAQLSERAFSAEYMPSLETFLKLALRAQSQCRATLETLAAIKSPPMLIAKQANLTTGPQQINNHGTMLGARATKKSGKQRNELLEKGDGKRLDAGAARTTSGVDSHMATLGAGVGADHGPGEEHFLAQCLQGGAASGAARVGTGSSGTSD